MPGNRTIRFAAIGILAGAFSGLFGVGGGIVMVPLLIMLGFGERRATATSLCAIVIIAALATALHGAYGNVRLGDAALLDRSRRSPGSGSGSRSSSGSPSAPSRCSSPCS